MSERELIAFSGIFSRAERQVIERAIGALEDSNATHRLPASFGAPWYVLAEELTSDERIFLANRLGTGQPITAWTADELAEKLRTAF